MVELFYGRFLAVGVLEGIVTHLLFITSEERLLFIRSFVSIVTIILVDFDIFCLVIFVGLLLLFAYGTELNE